MHDPLLFQRRLTARVLGVLGTASLASVYAACSSANAGLATAASSASTSTTTSSGQLASASTGTLSHVDGGHGGAAASGAGGAGGSGGSTTGTGGLPPVLSCLPWPPGSGVDAGADGDAMTGVTDAGGNEPDAAAPFSDAGAAPAGCPTDPKEVLTDFLALLCPNGWEPYRIVSGPMGTSTTECCYNVYNVLCGPGGRPYLVDGDALTAPVDTRILSATGWSAPVEVSREDLTAEDRAALAAAWAADAMMEHASVASFSRFSLALLAAGAPADLVELAHRAALDEIEHARVCFAIASSFAGETVAPGRFPIGASVEIGADLAALAASTVIEGCIGETVAAMVASERLAHATDPAVRAALERIAEDEARHAELAWRTVAWAVRVGDARVRDAVKRAFAQHLAAQVLPAPRGAPGPSMPLAAYGLLPSDAIAATSARAVATVVAPGASALLAARYIDQRRPVELLPTNTIG